MTVRLLLALFLLASAASGEIHHCAPNLCNGAAVISHPQPAGKQVLAYRVSPDGLRVIYVSNSSCKRELYSVAAIGGPVVQLSDLPNNVPEPCFRNVTDEFSISLDGRFAAWEADRDATMAPAKGDQDYELFSTPIMGGSVVQLNPPLPFDNDVERHKWSCDSTRVIYRQGKDSANRWELYSALARVPMSGQRISQVMGVSQAVGDFWVRCDGTVRFMADLTQSGSYKAFMTTVVPGGRIFTEIFADGFNDGTTGGWR